MPGERAVSYVTKAESPWMIRKWNADTGVIENVAPVLEGSEDYTWTADGTLFMGEGSVLYSLERNGKSWRRRANLGPHGISGITRLAVSQDGAKNPGRCSLQCGRRAMRAFSPGDTSLPWICLLPARASPAALSRERSEIPKVLTPPTLEDFPSI